MASRYAYRPVTLAQLLVVVAILVPLAGIAPVRATGGSQVEIARPPTLPFVRKAVCPFECCQFGEWIAKESLAVFANEFDTTEVAFSIEPEEAFVAESGDLVWERFGRILVRDSVRSFQPGDTIVAFACAGEEGFVIWEDGEFVGVEEFWARVERGESAAEVEKNDGRRFPAIMIEHPRLVWWVHVRNAEGRMGWLRLENRVTYCYEFEEQIDGMDACS